MYEHVFDLILTTFLCENASVHESRCEVGTKPIREAGRVQGAGSEALLARVLLEGVGAAARSLGRALREPGTLLCLVLLPVLEHYGVGPNVATFLYSLVLHSCAFDNLSG